MGKLANKETIKFVEQPLKRSTQNENRFEPPNLAITKQPFEKNGCCIQFLVQPIFRFLILKKILHQESNPRQQATYWVSEARVVERES